MTEGWESHLYASRNGSPTGGFLMDRSSLTGH
jgi:hypothetical protein